MRRPAFNEAARSKSYHPEMPREWTRVAKAFPFAPLPGLIVIVANNQGWQKFFPISPGTAPLAPARASTPEPRPGY